MNSTTQPPATSVSRTPSKTQSFYPTPTSTTMNSPSFLRSWPMERGNLCCKEAIAIIIFVVQKRKEAITIAKVFSISFLLSLKLKEWSIERGNLWKRGSLKSVKALVHRLGLC